MRKHIRKSIDLQPETTADTDNQARSGKPSCFYLFTKRVLDVFISLIGLIVWSPMLIIITALVSISGHGPVIYSEKRIGMNGKYFSRYKFRTMDFSAPSSGRMQDFINSLPNEKHLPLKTIALDPRITRIGRFLRKTSLDEFLQLYNVLKGDISLVGPRAGLRFEVAEYQDSYEPLLKCRPGLTGLSQLNTRYLEFDDMIKMDMDYIRGMSFWLDVKILLRTFGVVLLRRNAS